MSNFDYSPVITTSQTLAAVSTLQGEDLLRVGRQQGTIKRGQQNLDKGWANRTVKAAILDGTDEDARIEPDLRVTPLVYGKKVKHALALCAVDFEALKTVSFENSRLRASLSNIILIGREDEHKSGYRPRSRVVGSCRFSINDNSLLAAAIERDYKLFARKAARGQHISSTGDGQYIQVRTKGTGGEGNPITYAFYARPEFVEYMLGLHL
jgi:hypothetical protein